MKGEAKAELNDGALNTLVEYVIRFLRSALFLIREKHLGIDLSRINFASMRGNNVVDPNNGSIVTLVGKVEEKRDDSKDAKDMQDAFGANLSQLILPKTFRPSKLMLPLL